MIGGSLYVDILQPWRWWVFSCIKTLTITTSHDCLQPFLSDFWTKTGCRLPARHWAPGRLAFVSSSLSQFQNRKRLCFSLFVQNKLSSCLFQVCRGGFFCLFFWFIISRSKSRSLSGNHADEHLNKSVLLQRFLSVFAG